MTGDIGHLRFAAPAGPGPAPAPAAARTPRREVEDREATAGPRFASRPQADSVNLSSVPPAPPEDLLAEIDRARARAAELIAANRELHFVKDEHSGRIVVEVRDANGTVLRTIPPSRALAVMDGSAGLD